MFGKIIKFLGLLMMLIILLAVFAAGYYVRGLYGEYQCSFQSWVVQWSWIPYYHINMVMYSTLPKTPWSHAMYSGSRLRLPFTVLEWIGLVTVVVLTFWLCINVGYYVFIVLKYVIRFIYRLLVTLLTRANVNNTILTESYVQESMVQGSLLEVAKQMPKFQVEIWIRAQGELFYKSGQGFNTKFGLFTAWHVISEAYEVKIKSSTGEERIFNRDAFDNVEDDIAILVMPHQTASQMGMTQADLSEYAFATQVGLVVKIQSYEKSTMGMLRPSEIFGVVDYAGSTLKGFSGAPYYVNNKVYGMHLGAGAMNMGYHASYLYMVARSRQESTEDFLLRQLEGQDSVDYHRSPYNPDEARVRINDRYYLVDQDTLQQILSKKNVRQRSAYESPVYEGEGLDKVPAATLAELPLVPRAALTYDDSKNLIQPPSLGAVAKEPKSTPVQRQRPVTVQPQVVHQQPQPSMSQGPQQHVAAGEPGPVQIRRESNAPNDVAALLVGMDLESRKSLAQALSSGQELTLAQLRNLSPSMRKSMKKPKANRKNRLNLR